MEKPLKKEFDYYISQQQELVEKYNGKFIVIKGNNVVGIFDTQSDAVNNAQKEHELGTFLVQKVSSGENSHTQTFHSRVAFL